MWRKTYELVPSPMPIDFDVYAQDAENRYRDLLDESPSEARVQSFLESNPCFLPCGTSPGSHGPLHDLAFTQPTLPGLSTRRPDFLWITKHSAKWFPILIEIERPDRSVFRRDGIPTADFTKARHQLAEWRAWFAIPANAAKFVQEYGVPEDWVANCKMEPRFVLIMGRRSEVADDSWRSQTRAALMTAADEDLMSFDRLQPDPGLRHVMTVRASGGGRYFVRCVMPTMKLGPIRADRLPRLDGLPEVISADQRIAADRRAFLLGRLPYWTHWATHVERGIIGGDGHGE